MATWLVPRAITSARKGLNPVMADGDLVYDTEEEALYVGDDVTPGGVRVGGNATITITAGDQLDGGGVFTLDQFTEMMDPDNPSDINQDMTITIDHGPQETADTDISITADSMNRAVFLSGAQVDSNGHVISLEVDSVVEANNAQITIEGGSGLNTEGSNPDNTFTLNQDTAQSIILNHDDTSTLDVGAQTTLNQVINSVTVDGFGHVTAVGTTSVGAAMIPDDSIGASELDVGTNGSDGQFLQSDGLGGFRWDNAVQTITTGTGLSNIGAAPVNGAVSLNLTGNVVTDASSTNTSITLNRANGNTITANFGNGNSNLAIGNNSNQAVNNNGNINGNAGGLDSGAVNTQNGLTRSNNGVLGFSGGGGGYSVAETIAVNGFSTQVSVLAGDVLTPGNTAGRSGNDRNPIVRYFTGGMGLYNAAGTTTVSLSTDQGQNITASGNVLVWRSS